MKRVRTTVLVAVLGALAAFVLLVPASGTDSDPPECYSWSGYVVPCGLGPEQGDRLGFATAGAALAAVLVVAGSLAGRRDRARG